MGAYDIWNWIIFDFLPKFVPGFLMVSLDHKWYHNVIVGALWVAVYVGLNYLYYKVIGAPVWAAYRHMHSHGCKMLPWWHIAIYLFLLIYTAQNTTIGNGYINITPFVGILIAWLYFLIKAGWRVIYFPLLQALLLVFLFGAFCVFIPALIVLAFITILGGGVAALGRYPTCDGCKRQFETGGVCPYCGGTVS
jgi:hypothetical protein